MLVSHDATDVDMGRFKKASWARQAIVLVQGRVQANFAIIQANTAPTGNSGAKAGRGKGNQTFFMLEFECPGAAAGVTTKRLQRPLFRAALRYVPPPGVGDPFNFYHDLVIMLKALSGRTYTLEQHTQGHDFLARSTVNNVAAMQQWPPPTPNLDKTIHSPLCDHINDSPQVFCQGLSLLAFQILDIPADSPNPLIADSNVVQSALKGFTCPGPYPGVNQPYINQSAHLEFDKTGLRLPGPFTNLLASGPLLPQVDWSVVGPERSTLYWLFEKTQRLGPWAACAPPYTNQVPYPFAETFAPNFGPTTLYYTRGDHEDPIKGSNFTWTASAQSSVGWDSDNQKTFVLVFRGTRSRSEWFTNFKYNLVLIDEGILNGAPFLEPFRGMSIHAGYLGLLVQIYEAIKADVANAQPQRIIVAGHSLGGGLATLVSFALAIDFDTIPVDAALFAPPAVGDSSFAYWFNRRVNARRVAYVGWDKDQDPTESPFFSFGDVVPQALCPATPLCAEGPVPTKDDTKPLEWAQYEAVGGSVAFDWRAFPDAPYGLNADAIRERWRVNGEFGPLADGEHAHICSYSCFLSTTVDTELTKCLFYLDTLLPNLSSNPNIPQIVKDSGLCT